ncbi:MAG: hypothetical protein A2X19_04280 [Bacteroidetes bacterium GWE2_39_28]|nr:MAG: hypothetical protein A2X19_04280 [Bacteroidetes bacterium GWE2_39_28]OFY13131.1 MAG: hypothetical protein A2X16_00555 [Bacteroidetes bacterium GWF2_39_10]OFZ10902.1 MAG: hypothetical protein A2465_10035 [Bacteroidetes bacterium RIFOXYC2_FULL_39_11]HCT94063.1 hypothetical protein [Rikenellaceae bacterium]
MRKLNRINYVRLFLLIPFMVLFMSCEKIDENKVKIPLVTFETSQISVNTETGSYDVVLKLSEVASKELTIKVGMSGSATENEHYTVASKEIKIPVGTSEGKLPITILHNNIWDENLEIIVILAPGTDYVIDPKQVSEIKIKLTKQIVLPVMSFDMEGTNLHTNPFNAEIITLKLKLDQPLRAESQVNLAFDGDMTIGADFAVNGGNSNKITVPKDVTSHTFTLKINKKDNAGFNKNLKITVSPVDQKTFTVNQEKSSFTLKVHDPLVDMTPILKTAALLGGSGFQIYQNVKTTTGWSSNITVNAIANTIKKNYLKTFRNTSFNTAFGCESNAPGGDVLRLGDLLNFANTDTVIADYGVGKTTRHFNPSDSLLRFVADGENPLKGTVTTVPQKFSANIVLKVDWETGTNGFKQWHLDSKATGGKIEMSTYPVIAAVVIDLEKVEGSYDFTLATPEILFTAWFKSSSPYFMKNLNSTYDIVKEGDQYKVSYRYIPR